MLEAFQNLFAPPRHMILLVLAAWIGLALAERRTERHGIGKDDLNNLVFYAFIAFIAGGRVSFILQNLAAFSKKPLDVLSINPDLFDLPGAMAAALLAALIFGQRKQLAFWNSLDALAPLLAALSVGLGLSRLAEGAILGIPTRLPWGLTGRHPIPLYETLASLLTLSLLMRIRWNPRPGIFFLIFGALTALSHLFIQAFRADDIRILNGINQAQVFAWIALAVSFVLIEARTASPRT
jgi:phosphatidylglycerol:prolipoprotein diacylglycerol transferase